MGFYNPLTHPPFIYLDLEKIDAWMATGAKPSDSVSHLIDIAREGDKPAPVKPQKKSKKQQEKDRVAAEEAAAAAAEDAE